MTVKPLVDPGLWPELLRYSYFASATYSDNCANPPYDAVTVDDGFINEPSTDTQGYIFRSDADKEIIAAFRGTSVYPDVATDFDFGMVPWVSNGVDDKNCQGCYAHSGFLRAWNSIEAKVLSLIDRELEGHPDYKVTFTGHSLGGALSVFAYATLKNTREYKVRAITLGQPRVTNQEGADFLDKLAGATDYTGEIIRITHMNDVVPHIPPQWSGFSIQPPQLMAYVHTKGEIWQGDNKDGSQDADNTYRCFGQEPADGNNGQGPNYVYDGVHQAYSGLTMGSQGCEGENQ